MTRLFLSYDRRDLDRAASLAKSLERAGHSIWWDRNIKGGAQYSKEIEQALACAKAVVVLWSTHSVDSAWVRDEAATARDSGRLVPVTLDGTEAPLGFRQYQTIDLSGRLGSHRRALVQIEEAIGSIVDARDSGLPVNRTLVARTTSRLPGTGRNVGALTAVASILLLGTAGAAWFISGWRPGSSGNSTRIAMAVLPFDAIPADQQNSPFAEGLAEEISGELARNPRLQMIGRTSAATFQDSKADARTIGRKLRVAYLLDGTVRRSGNQVRVGVELVNVRDGALLWRHNYSGTIDDTFAIQDRIGQSVEGLLRASFVGKEGVTARSLATRGDVYSYYLTARTLLREPGKFTGSRKESIETAANLLRKAVALDPNYAPAWAQLSGAVLVQREVTGTVWAPEAKLKMRNQAIVYADQALALAPQLAEAHYAKARTLVGPEGRSQGNRRGLETAARLDPNSANVWFSLANYHAWNGDFAAELEARRKAVAIDPLWLFAFGPAIQSAWDLGLEEEARRYSQRVERHGVPWPFQAHMIRSDTAARNGDLSLQLAEGLAGERTADQGHRSLADSPIAEALRAAGELSRARRVWPYYEVDDIIWKLWHGQPPPSGHLAGLSRTPGHVWGNTAIISLLLKALVNHGRSREVVDLYRRQFGTPERLQRYPAGHVQFVSDATTVAIALRNVRSDEESNRLLAFVRQSVDQRLRRGRIPRQYFFHAALVAAAQRDDQTAIRWLEHADGNKWWYSQQVSLPDIADEPAFQRLKSSPRFQAVAARQRAWRARERREMAPLLGQLGSI